MYHLTRFGTVVLPEYNPNTDIGAGSSRLAYYDLPGGGSFDNFGAGQAPLNSLNKLAKKCTLLADNPIAIQQQLDGLKGLVGQRNKLYATLPDGSERWLWARLTEVKGERKPAEPLWLHVELSFSSPETCWHGQPRVSSQVGSGTLTLPHNGNAPVTTAIIHIASPAATLGFTVTGKSHFVLTGLTGPTVIDCGAMRVTDNGVEAYSKFALQTDHHTAAWLEIEPPSTRLIFSGSGTLTVSYEDAWR